MLLELATIWLTAAALTAWRWHAVRDARDADQGSARRVFTKYLWVLAALIVLGVATAIPFSLGSRYPTGVDFPLGLRRLYILLAHASYATALAALAHCLIALRTASGRVNPVITALVVLISATCVLATLIVSAIYGKGVFGTYWFVDPQRWGSLILFSGLTLVTLSANARSLPALHGRWRIQPTMETAVLIAVIVMKAASGFVGMNMDALPWL